MTLYCTSFCNFAHDLKDGKPIEHECYILNPEALKLEREGRCHEALALGMHTGRIHKGKRSNHEKV